MNTLPKHIQETATPLTDKLEFEQECNFDVSWEDHARNLERLTIWQQEVIEKLSYSVHAGIGTHGEPCKNNKCQFIVEAEVVLNDYTQLQSYLKTLKGEK